MEEEIPNVDVIIFRFHATFRVVQPDVNLAKLPELIFTAHNLMCDARGDGSSTCAPVNFTSLSDS